MEDISGIDSETLQRALAADIGALTEAGAVMPFVFEPAEAFALMALLQLALRHPAVDGYPRQFGENLAREIEERLGKTPAIREAARRGWLPSEDV